MYNVRACVAVKRSEELGIADSAMTKIPWFDRMPIPPQPYAIAPRDTLKSRECRIVRIGSVVPCETMLDQCFGNVFSINNDAREDSTVAVVPSKMNFYDLVKHQRG